MRPAANGLQRFVQRLAALGPMSWILARTLYRLDTPLIRVSGGRRSLTNLLTGLPVVMLTTVGAKTGRRRSSPLVGLTDGKKLVLIASYFGSRHSPAWYHNLRRHPEAHLVFNGRSGAYIAREAAAAEYETYWQQAVAVYAGYAAYQKRNGGRRIPILVLTPKEIEL